MTETTSSAAPGNSSVPKDLPPYTVRKGGALYFQPTPEVQALGFVPEALGPDSPAAMAKAWSRYDDIKKERERQRAERLKAKPYDGTFNHLADVYRGIERRGLQPSRQWRELADNSRKDYGRYIDKFILPMWGESDVRKSTTEAIQSVHEQMAATPYAANNWLSTVSAMIEVALTKPSIFGLTENPAQKVPRFGKKSGAGARRKYWEDDREKTFLAKAFDDDWEIYVSYFLLVYTGQRPIDCLKMSVADYDGVKIHVVQQKTGATVWIKAHRDLKAVLDEHLARRKREDRIGGMILQNKSGGQFKPRYFAMRWSKVEVAAGLRAAAPKREKGVKESPRRQDWSQHQRRDLRRTAVIRLAEAECTILQIAAITGHSPKSIEDILRVYWVSTYPQAAAAIAKLEDYRSGKDVDLARLVNESWKERSEDSWKGQKQ